ncbi:carbohydrate ABC transporter permease [Nesterenkonia sp. K-15-9-6]|uniref:carbohydrate ABC transporter permease n=1 Tax=Nesterenkonia sp. K-15-9-6 TaxID=3093918 RepID=UPI00404458F3
MSDTAVIQTDQRAPGRGGADGVPGQPHPVTGRPRPGKGSTLGSPMRSKLALTITYVVLLALALIWLLPVVFALSTSFKSPTEFAFESFRLLPAQWVADNYVSLLNDVAGYPVLRWFWNSMFISTMHALLTVVVVSIAGYGYSRLDFPGKDVLFFTLLAISLFPVIANLIPLYEIVSRLGWVNSPWAMIVPGLAGVANIFLVRAFLAGIPKEMDDAARIDGAGDFQIFFRIVLPMIRPILIVIFLFAFTGSWNDFLWPLIVFNDVDQMPITAGLQLLQNMLAEYDRTGQLMASAVMAMIPTLILFLVAQRYFVSSLSMSSGIKG